MHLKIKVAEIKMDRIGAGCDFVVMKTIFLLTDQSLVQLTTTYWTSDRN